MRACLGTSCAMIRAVHAANGRKHTSQRRQRGHTSEEYARISEVLEPPGEAESLGAINAQDAWWFNPDGEMPRLTVPVVYRIPHPMGSVVGANGDNACYFIAFYRMDGDGEYEIDTYVGPFYGKAQTVSPTASAEVAILVRKAPGQGPAARQPGAR